MKHVLAVKVPHRLLDEPDYIQQVIRHAKHQAVEKMLDKAWHGRYWVIRFDEHWPEEWEKRESMYSFDYREPEYRIEFTIQEARSQEVVVPKIPDFNSMPLMPLTLTAIQEIKYRSKRWVKTKYEKIMQFRS